MKNEQKPSEKDKLDVFFEMSTIACKNQSNLTLPDIRKMIMSKHKNIIRHFCQDLLSDAKYYVENQNEFAGGDDSTEEQYILDVIKNLSEEE